MSQAAVLVASDARPASSWSRYVVPAAGDAVDAADAAPAFVGDALPAYMVPAAVVVLDAFPLNADGKLDRKALPAPVFEAARVPGAGAPPVEEIVAGVFAEVLGARHGSALDDDFFELGGNSLIATQVAARLGAALDTRVPVRELFEAPTVAALAAQARVARGRGGRLALVARERPDADSAVAGAAADVVPQPVRHRTRRRTTSRSRCG